MISLWALLTESDLEAYAATLVLPRYLAHLRLPAKRCHERREMRQIRLGLGKEPTLDRIIGKGRDEGGDRAFLPALRHR